MVRATGAIILNLSLSPRVYIFYFILLVYFLFYTICLCIICFFYAISLFFIFFFYTICILIVYDTTTLIRKKTSMRIFELTVLRVLGKIIKKEFLHHFYIILLLLHPSTYSFKCQAGDKLENFFSSSSAI